MSPSSLPIIQAHGLTKDYGKLRVVDRISFAIDAGECCGVLGPNGAGKTTTMKMLIGATPPTAGELRVLGHAVPQDARAMRARIGVVAQSDNLDPDFTVEENLRVYARYFGLSAAEVRTRIPELLELASLQDKAGAKINQLSGGMKRRLSIARALLNRPELLILDEPTTGLDPQIRQAIWQLLRQLRRDGLTIVLTTHYMDEAERLCGRIILMDGGHILADASPQALIRDRIESHVVEVHGAGCERWLATAPIGSEVRRERAGESWFFYGRNLESLVRSLDEYDDLHYSYRSSNLEDVFLKLTGRDLRDG
ncbi:ATP-binding cassette domain-containing protein [Methylolobus aquaticus]